MIRTSQDCALGDQFYTSEGEGANPRRPGFQLRLDKHPRVFMFIPSTVSVLPESAKFDQKSHENFL